MGHLAVFEGISAGLHAAQMQTCEAIWSTICADLLDLAMSKLSLILIRNTLEGIIVDIEQLKKQLWARYNKKGAGKQWRFTDCY